MQNRLVQSTCEAFAALEISYSRLIFQPEVLVTDKCSSHSMQLPTPESVKMNCNGFVFDA